MGSETIWNVSEEFIARKLIKHCRWQGLTKTWRPKVVDQERTHEARKKCVLRENERRLPIFYLLNALFALSIRTVIRVSYWTAEDILFNVWTW